MSRQPLKAEQYTAGIATLTVDDLDRYGRRIIPSSTALAILEKKAKRKLDRNVIIQKCRAGTLHPMGTYKNTLYFWRQEVEHAEVRQRKMSFSENQQNDKNSS